MMSGKRTRTARRTYQTAKKAAKAVIMKNVETKHASNGIEDLYLYHNGAGIASGAAAQPNGLAVLDNVWFNVVPGTSVINRVGNEIFPRGISIRFYLENMIERPNIHFRVIAGFRPKTNSDGTLTSVISMKEMLDAGSNGNLIRHTSTDQGYTFIYDRVFRAEMGANLYANPDVPADQNNVRSHTFKKIWLRPRKGSKIIYPSSATGVAISPINRAFFFTIIPYDSYNTLTTDNIARVSLQYKLYWKDA